MPSARLLSLLLLAEAAGLSAQQPMRLKPADATLPFEFSRVTSLVEVDGGKVVITDWSEQAIFLGDFATGKLAKVGRQGEGPGEYFSVVPMVLIGRDSALMPNLLARHLFLTGSSGKALTPTLSFEQPLWANVHSYDLHGHILQTREPRITDRNKAADSSFLILTDHAGKIADTIGTVRTEYRSVASLQNGGPRSMPRYGLEREGAVLAPDGWMAVVRLSPYRVDWRSPEGRWTRGAAITDAPVRVTEREKKAYADREATRAAGRSSTPRGALPGNVGFAAAPQQVQVSYVWPETIPPIELGASRVFLPTRDGRLLVGRVPSADFPDARYDVFTHQGTRDGQLRLGPDQKILAFGERSVYILTSDDDGLQKVSRHPWP